LYEKGINDPEWGIRKEVAQSLSGLAKVAPEKAIPLYEKGINDSDRDVRKATVQSLGELAKVAPEKAIPLYEKGINDPYWGIAEGTAQSLGELAKVAPEKYLSLYEKGINDSDRDVRRATAQSLGELAKIDPEKAIPLYEKGINDPDMMIRRGTARSLGELAKVAPEKYLSLYEKGLNDPSGWVRHATAQSLGELAKIVPEKAIPLYEKGINDPDVMIRRGTAQSLGELAKIAPEKAIPLYEKGINDSDRDVRRATAQSLGELAKIDPEKAIPLYEKGINDPDVMIRRGTAQSLGELAKVAPEKYLSLYEKGINDSDRNVRRATAQSLGELAKISPEKYFSLYKKGINNPDWAVRKGTTQSLSGLAKVAPEKAIPLYEKGINDPDMMIRRGTAQSLGELAKVAPEKYLSLYEKGINDSDWDIREATAQSLGELAKTRDFKQQKKIEKIEKILEQKYQLTEEEKVYAYQVIANLLKEKKDLGEFSQQYLPRYLAIKKLARKINNQIEESKKWKNPEEFFNKYNLDIANLQFLDPNLGSQVLKNHIVRGLSFAEAYINVFKPALDNPEIVQSIKKYIKTTKNLDGYNLADLLEIASAYQSLEEVDLLIKTINSKTKNFQELKSKLNQNLLKKVAENLNIKTKISEQELSQWKIKYFGNLVTNQELIEKEGDEDNLELYNHTLKAILENRFKEFISDLNQDDEIGQEIAEHNKEVEKEFKEHNINWDKWLNFKEQVIMSIGTRKKQEREALFEQFESRFKQWQEEVNKSEPRLKASLDKDLARLSQKKKEFDPSKINLNDPKWIEQLLPTYVKSLNYLKTKDPNFKLSPEAEESFNHLIETIKSLNQKQEKEKTAKKEFVVKLWDRDPRKDMFQGNQTHCCIAVGVKETPPGGGMATIHPETIFQYLIDKGINVAEIVDPETGDVVAQTWLFVTLDQNNEPVLVADNFEVNSRYPAGNNVNRGIRKSMFEFLKRYAQECNIGKVVLGKVSTNDVETSDLKVVSLPHIGKLGGYFNDDEYYLETLGHTQALEVK